MIVSLRLMIVNEMMTVSKELQELFAATPTKKHVDRRYLFVRIQIQTIVITLHVELLINAKVSHIAIGVYADMIHLWLIDRVVSTVIILPIVTVDVVIMNAPID